MHLSNVTSTLGPKYPELYWIKLDVFHQLHCLVSSMFPRRVQVFPTNIQTPLMQNALRMSVWSDYYTDEYYAAILEKDHLAHCVDSLRQSIMCHSDITPLVLQWDDEMQKSRHRANMPHTCRDFGKIRDWAMNRAIAQMKYEGNWMDPDLHVDGVKIQEP
ncbi:hypothetical protein MPH_12550 [Macrophomina phaseolina MS6]|uniref:Uncharacterized protein n=1 Tax=Macrophomina phaseolina (strain MS6) TaxID=1126212 RepID=K2R7M7_MACPH|nr:hypothetical protein MPH_12550 [Macrophomina phaseolina MS6]